jgi:ribulose-5-phosphate 4-epimerase/fuculose-1-phosphate aldolase
MTEGYIKFNCIWDQKEIQMNESLLEQLSRARTKLYDLGLIGMYPDGIGFGNISVKTGNSKSFIITGSATGQFATLNASHYAEVTGFNFSQNSIACRGQTKASAESLSHAAVYESIPEVGAVVHVHCLWLWEKLLNNFPTTSSEIEYGTPEMAAAIQSLISLMQNGENLIVMGGHREGILVFGKDMDSVTDETIKIFKQYQNE